MNKSVLIKNNETELKAAIKNGNPLGRIAYSEVVQILNKAPDQKTALYKLRVKVMNCGGMAIETTFAGTVNTVKEMTEEEWNS